MPRPSFLRIRQSYVERAAEGDPRDRHRAHRRRHLDEPEELGGGADGGRRRQRRGRRRLFGRGRQCLRRRAAARPPCREARPRWASACSTMRRSPPAMRRSSMAPSASPSSTGTSITATARRTFSGTIPSVLYCSTHQMPLYPGTGAKDETGAGNIVNAPLSPGTGSDLFREAFTVAHPAGARQFRARPDHHFRRLRRASPRSAGRDQSRRGRFRLGDRPVDGARRASLRATGSSACSKAATICRDWHFRWRPMSAA